MRNSVNTDRKGFRVGHNLQLMLLHEQPVTAILDLLIKPVPLLELLELASPLAQVNAVDGIPTETLGPCCRNQALDFRLGLCPLEARIARIVHLSFPCRLPFRHRLSSESP